MYSVVMLMAMTAAPDAASCCHNGCGYSAGCYGSYSSCYGYGSCHGGYAFGGCSGWSNSYSCQGGWGVPYSCNGYGIYGGTGYLWPTPYYGGGTSSYGYGYPAPAPAYAPPVIIDKRDGEIRDREKKDGIKGKTMYLPVPANRAQVIVNLPADARLYANGQLTALTSAERVFVSPVLEANHNYQYSLKVEFVRDGKTISDSKVVNVRAGESSQVSFDDRVTKVASRIRVKLPAGAKLYVNDLAREIASDTQEFKTPELVKGSEYSYQFRAETMKDGKIQSQTQRVVFQAGEPVTVDFTDKGSLLTAQN